MCLERVITVKGGGKDGRQEGNSGVGGSKDKVVGSKEFESVEGNTGKTVVSVRTEDEKSEGKGEGTQQRSG